MLISSEERTVIIRGDKKDCYLNYYKCDWCGLEFEQVVRKGYGESRAGDKQSRPVSTQIQCARCKGFIKTYN